MSMVCSQCGEPLGDDGLCAVCLMAGGFESLTTQPEVQTLDRPLADFEDDLDMDHFGPYTILEPLGEGGMGTVYLAEQSAPIRRRVALKVIRPGLDSKGILSRFQYERQALALMDHPNIARVFDAGATVKGRPFFVMEYIDGEPINTYCDHHRLNTKDRLKLFIPVCQAVHHAHSKGVLHRDIKPSNVLVTEVDGAAVPKVIDFGIAKATAQRSRQQTMFTQFGQFLGTPEYMSPEAADLVNADVDTTSDVYSLGILLYELLVGAVPFDSKLLAKVGLAEWLRVVREQEVLSLPAKLSEIGKAKSQTLTKIAGQRSTSPAGLRLEVAGELNLISLKAVEKQRERRYESAQALAADIQRYLENKPVLASPPSAAYRFRKFAQRNRAVVAGGLAVSAALVIGFVTTLWQARNAIHEREIAVRERAAAVLHSRRADEQRTEAETQRMETERQRHVAETQRARAEESLRDVATLAKTILFTMDDQVKDLGGSTAARRTLLNLGLEYLRKSKSDDPDLGLPYFRVAELQGLNGLRDTEAAKQNYRRSRELLLARLSARSKDGEARRLIALSTMRLGQLEDSKAARDDAYKTAEGMLQRLNADEPGNAQAMLDLSRVLVARQEPEKAVTLARRATQLGAVHPADRAVLAEAQLALSVWLLDRQTAGDSIRWNEESVATWDKIVQEEPGNIPYQLGLCDALLSLSQQFREINEPDKSRAAAQKAVDISRRAAAIDRESPAAQQELAKAEYGLAQASYSTGTLEQGRKEADAANRILREQIVKYPNNSQLRFDLVDWLQERAGPELAANANEELLSIGTEILNTLSETARLFPQSRAASRRFLWLSRLAIIQSRMGKYDLANAAGIEAVTGLRRLLGPSPSDEDRFNYAEAEAEYAGGLFATRQLKDSLEHFLIAQSQFRLINASALDPFQFSREAHLFSLFADHGKAVPLEMKKRLDASKPMLEAKYRENPWNRVAFQALWESLAEYREAYTRMQDSENLLAVSRRMLDVSKRNLAARPADVARMDKLSEAMNNLTFDLTQVGKREEALAAEREFLQLSSERLNALPADTGAKLKVLDGALDLVRYLTDYFDEPSEAIPLGLKVISAAEAFAKADPNNPQAAEILATAYWDVSTSYMDDGQIAQALDLVRRRSLILSSGKTENPDDLAALAVNFIRQARLEERLGNSRAVQSLAGQGLAVLEKERAVRSMRLEKLNGKGTGDLLDLSIAMQHQAQCNELNADLPAATRSSEQAVAYMNQTESQEAGLKLPTGPSTLRSRRAELFRYLSLQQAPQTEFQKWGGRPLTSEEIERFVAYGWFRFGLDARAASPEQRARAFERAISTFRKLAASHTDNQDSVDLAQALLSYTQVLLLRAGKQQSPASIADLRTAHDSAQESLLIWTELFQKKAIPSESYAGMGSARLQTANAANRLEKLGAPRSDPNGPLTAKSLNHHLRVTR
jgi:serine/threonine protein kinase